MWGEMQKPEDAPPSKYVLCLCEEDLGETAYEVMTEFFIVGMVNDGEVIPDYGPVFTIKGWWSLPKKEKEKENG